MGHSRLLVCQNKGFWSKAFGRRSPYSLTISSLSEKGPKIEVAKPKAKASPLTNRETPGTKKIYRRPCLGHTSFVPSSKPTSRLFFPIMACSGGSYQIEQQHIQMPEPLAVCAENHAEKDTAANWLATRGMTASCTFVLLNPPKDSCADTVLVEGRQGPIPKQVLVIKSGPDAPAFQHLPGTCKDAATHSRKVCGPSYR